MGATAAPGPIHAVRAGVRRVRAASVLGWMSLVGFVIAPFLAWLSPLGQPFTTLGPAAFAASMLSLVAGANLRGWLSPRRADVRVDGDALVLARTDGRAEEQRLPLAEISHAFVVPGPETSQLELWRKDGNVVEVVVPTKDAPALEKLVAATGLDTSKRRVRMRAGGARSAAFRAVGFSFLLTMVIVPLLIAFAPGWGHSWGLVGERALRTAILAVIAGGGALLAQASLGPEVIVGSDGVTIKRLGRRRFVRHADIAKLELGRAGQVLATLAGGEVLSLGLSLNPAYAEALIAQIRRAGEAPSVEAPARGAFLDRRGRDLATWRAELEKLREQGGDYRDAPLRDEEMAAILADPEVPADRRLGAALAMAKSEEGPARIRVAADASADERVRVAFESIAAGEPDEEAILRAVERE